MSSLASNVPEQSRKACVACGKYQPPTGKFLACLHIVCHGCLADSTTRDGSFTCLICPVITRPQMAGVELCRQLVDSAPFLSGPESQAADELSVSGSSEATVCEPCNDIDIEEIASHQCDDCDGLPLCRLHADKHTKRKHSLDHRVLKRPDFGSSLSARPATASKVCMHHTKYNVVTYCQSCKQCVCERCIASGGHEGHIMESLAAAAAKLRAKVQQFVESGPLTSLSSTSASGRRDADSFTDTEALLSSIDADISIVREEAEAVSKLATERFDEMEKMLKDERNRTMNEIDHRLWKQLDPLEEQKQHLESLRERQATVQDLSSSVLALRTPNESLLRISGVVIEYLQTLSKDLREFESPAPPRFFAKLEPLATVQENFKRAVQLCDSTYFDLSNSRLAPKQQLYVGTGSQVAVFMYDLCGRRLRYDPRKKIPAVLCSITSPSGAKTGVIAVSRLQRYVSLDIAITPKEPGVHMIDLVNSVTEVRLPMTAVCGVCFDASKCHDSVMLSNDHTVATVAQEGWCNVLATTGYTNGRHTWNLRLKQTGGVTGVTSCPRDGNYNNENAFFGEQATAGAVWWSDGKAFLDGGRCEAGEFKRGWFAAGDVLAFTLDCDRRSLQCLNRRTNESRTIPNVNCTQSLYPCVTMFYKDCVEISA